MTSFDKRKLRVLFSHYGIKDGDGFGRTFMLARELAALDHDVTFLTSQQGEFVFPLRRERRSGVEIISFPDIVPKSMRKGGLGPLNILMKSLYALMHEYDIVHSDGGHRPASGIPCTVHRFFKHSTYISEWWDYFGKGGIQDDQPWWYRATLGTYDTWAEVHNKRIADGVVALSEFTKQRAMKIGVPVERILVLHGGADTRTIQNVSDTRNRAKFGIPKEALVFGFVGMNEHELLDLEPFIQAINAVKDSKPVCWFSTGRKLSFETRTKYGLGPEYHEFGWVDYDQYSDLLSCADAFVLLSRDNLVNKARWPNKFGDYLAAGRVTLTNPSGDLKEYIERHVFAFEPVEWDITSVRQAIEILLEGKNRLMQRGRRTRGLAESELSWSNRASVLDLFYARLVHQQQ